MTRFQPDSNFQIATISIMSNMMPITSIISAMLSAVSNVFTDSVKDEEEIIIIKRKTKVNNAAGTSTISASIIVFLMAAL